MKKANKIVAWLTTAAMAVSASMLPFAASAATYKRGDVDLDGRVGITDVITLCKSLMGDGALTATQAAVADCDGASGVTTNDALQILRYLVALIDDLGGDVEVEETTESTEEETVAPTEEETTAPTEEETIVDPTEEETVAPTEEETAAPTEEETTAPTEEETVEPTEEETAAPTEEETVEPTEEETTAPTEEETVEPTEEETTAPTEEETVEPTEEETAAPTEEETAAPTEEETAAPTEEETAAPTEEETAAPTEEETEAGLEGTTEVGEAEVVIETDENGNQKSIITVDNAQSYEKVQLTISGGVPNCSISFFTYYGYWDNELGEWVNGEDCPSYDAVFDENGTAVLIVDIPADEHCTSLQIGISYYHSWSNEASDMVPNDQEGLTWEVVAQLVSNEE